VSLPKRSLGRGLAELLELRDGPLPRTAIRELTVVELEPNPFQPRRDFDPEALQALADSVREHGILQPLLVTEREGRYLIIAGERRWRAAQMAGLDCVPVVVRTADDQALAALALIENLQRADLSVLEQAQALRRLRQDYDLTLDALARQIGMSRPHLNNLLRLLDLPEYVLGHLARGALSFGHARALAAQPTDRQIALTDECLRHHWSVRQLERAVKRAQSPPPEPVAAPPPRFELEVGLRDQLERELGCQVRVLESAPKGSVTLQFSSDNPESLWALINRLSPQISSD